MKESVTRQFRKTARDPLLPWAGFNSAVVEVGRARFPAGQLRKSHDGLAPTSSDHDPDSRLSDRIYFLAAIAGKTFSPEMLWALLMKQFSQIDVLRRAHGKGFLRHKRALKKLISTKQGGKPDRPAALWRRIFSSPWPRLSLDGLLLSRARVCFTGPNQDEPRP